MMAFLPPISAITRLIQICPGWVWAARATMSKPTSFEPVKAIMRVWGCSTMALPAVAPPPGTKLKTPSGKPASIMISAIWAPMPGVSLEGLSTTVLPVTSAAKVMPARMAAGKFQGGITTTTPSGM